MRQFIVATANAQGEFMAINTPSNAASAAGLTESGILGAHFWDFCTQDQAEMIQKHFAECLIHRRKPRYTITSTINGRDEVWDNTLVNITGSSILAIAREVFPKKTLEVSDEDQQILNLLCDDKTTDQIAETLQMVPNTLAKKLQRLRERCNVQTNHGLVSWCLRYGVL